MKEQKEKWNQFIIANNGSFLQSFEWGLFQESLGRKIWRLEIAEIKALLIKHDLPLGKNYLYCPRGPVGVLVGVAERSSALLRSSASLLQDRTPFFLFLEKVKKIAKEEKAIFFKIEPDKTENSFPPAGGKLFSVLSQKQIQPQRTLILDITKPEEELLNQMHPKTRYNIKLAQRKGVEIRIISFSEQEEIETFWQLLEQTAQRDKFHLHPKIYYQKMLEVLGREGLVKLLIAQYQNKIIAANIVCFFGDTATYLHGASDYHFHQLMAPHLCQWQAILEAKRLGFQFYDFWGIDEKKWPGLTRFKKGFGGQEVNYAGAFDLVFQPCWYKIYSLARQIL